MIPRALGGQPQGGADLAEWLPAGSFVFNGATGQIVGMPWTQTGAISRVGSSSGLLSATGATAARYDAGRVQQAQPGAMTVIAVVRRTAGAALHYVGGTVGTGTAYLEHLAVNADSGSALLAGSINYRVRVDVSNDFSATVANAVNANAEPQVIAFQWLTATTMDVWVDGVQKTPTYTNLGTTPPAAGLTEFSYSVLNRNVRGAWTEGQTANQVGLFARIPTNDVDLARLTRSPRDAYAGLFQPRRIWVPVGLSSGATNYTLSGAAGSYAVTGRTATFNVSRSLSGAAGSYALSGQTAAFKVNHSLSGAAGAYSYSGKTATFNVSRFLSGAAGSYALTGNAATLSYTPGSGTVNYTLSGSAGAYSLSGQSATFRVAHTLSGAAGSYAYSGQTGSFRVAHTLTGAPGAYAFSGKAGTFTYTSVGPTAYTLSGASGGYSLIGRDGTFDWSGAAKGGAPDYSPRRRYVVKIGNRIVEYSTAAAAMRAMQAYASNDAEPAPEPVAEVPIRTIKAKARVFKAEKQVQDLFKQQDYSEMLALYQRMVDQQDEDEVEMLLMTL